VVLFGGIIWTALEREPEWIGWGLVAAGVAWLIASLRR
jgi:hypothetical protein